MRLPVVALTSAALGFLAAPLVEEALDARAAPLPAALVAALAFVGARLLVALGARAVARAAGPTKA